MPCNWYGSWSWGWCQFYGKSGRQEKEGMGRQGASSTAGKSISLKSVQVCQMYTPLSCWWISRFCPVETQPKVMAWKQVKEPLVTIQCCVPDNQKTAKTARKIQGKGVYSFLLAFLCDISSGILFPNGKIQMIISLWELQREKNNALDLQPSSNSDYLCSRHNVLLFPKGTELILISSISTFKRGFIFFSIWLISFIFFFVHWITSKASLIFTRACHMEPILLIRLNFKLRFADIISKLHKSTTKAHDKLQVPLIMNHCQASRCWS